MSQQEFEPRQQRPEAEIYQSPYQYTWSEQEGMPKDEPPSSYNAQTGQYDPSNAAQVPWWARAQPQQSSSFAFAGIVLIALLVIFAVSVLGILGFVLGTLGHILGIILGLIFAVIIFVLVLVAVILALIGHAFRSAFGLSDRRAWRYNRRMARRAWRDSWRGW